MAHPDSCGAAILSPPPRTCAISSTRICPIAISRTPPLCPLTGSPYDFSHTDELIARAVESTSVWLADGSLEHPRIHKQLGLHKHGV